ncbi:MAG TPA: hypothetical protein VG733_01490 [Chthoniobacteraceae bacterium]|nr:hypothetical protein [Chthoniobacteraceae bacterium]
MKLDRLNEYVLATTVVVCGVLLAIICGRFAGTGQNFWLWLIAGIVIYLLACFWLRTKTWVLILVFWSWSGQLNSVPGHMPVRDLVVGGVVVFFFTLKAFKVIRYRPSYSWLDIIMGLNVLYIIALYLRYPIGVNAFGSENVGGRPYIEIIFALGAYWVLNQVFLMPKRIYWFPFVLCASAIFFFVLDTFTYLVPSTVPILGKLYGGVDAESYRREEAGDDTDEGDVRTIYLADAGTKLINIMSSYFSPLTFINPMYFWRFLAFFIAIFFCLKSGHRITIPAIAAAILLTTYFRNGIAAVIIMILIAIPPAVVAIAGQGRLYELPHSIQRTLCFLPGEWNPDVLNEAEGSIDWRVEMWDEMMHEDKYIHDKVFGDGFGFTREQLEDMAFGGTQEDFMETNSPHSGPISTIRVSGYVGFGLFVLLLFGCCVRSWRLIRMTKGTKFFPVCLFVGVPTIYSSIGFVFIFGDYKNDILSTILGVGILNILSRSFAAYQRSIEEPPPAPALKKTVQPLAPMPMPALH